MERIGVKVGQCHTPASDGWTGCVWLVMIARLRGRAATAADRDQILQFRDVEHGSEAIFTDDDEQASAADNATIACSQTNQVTEITIQSQKEI